MEITRLQEQVKEWGKSTTDILSLTDELKMGSIEKVIGIIWSNGVASYSITI